MKRLAGRYWFLLALAVVYGAGVAFYRPLAPIAESVPRDPLVAAILLAMSLPLDLRGSLAGRGAVAAAVVGVVVNAVLAGPLALAMGGVLAEPLRGGLVVAALAPSTLASGAVWTRRGGGNEAVALVITVVTNLACFVTLPAWGWLLLGADGGVDALGLGLRLLAVVVAPVAAGQLLRRFAPVRAWADGRRGGLSLAAQLGLLAMVFVGATRCGATLADPASAVGVGQGGLLALVVLSLHLTLFAAAWSAARWGGATRADALGSAIGGSQKTLAVGLTVAMDYGPLAILPIAYYHALQLLVDAWLVERLAVRR